MSSISLSIGSWAGDRHIVLSLLAGGIGLILLRAILQAVTGPLRLIPGTLLSTWSDLPVRLRTLSGTRAQYVHALHERYGPVVRLGPREVDVSDIDAVREIHRVRAPFVKSGFYGPGGRIQSMFSTRDPDFHARRRRLLGPYFSEASLASFETTATELIGTTVEGILEESGRDGCVDLLKWWTLMAMDVIAELTFGESFDMVRNGERTQFSDDVGRLGSILPLRSAFPIIFTVGAYLPFVPFFHEIVLSRQRILAVQQKRVARCMELVKADDSKGGRSIFGALVKRSDAEKLEPLDLIIEAQSFITAGTDTTAVTMTYLVWAVIQDGSVHKRLVDELEKLPQDFVHNDLRTLPYLNAVIDEVLRCYGAAPGSLPRVVPAGGAVLAEHAIPEGIVVSTQAYSLHRDPQIFPDPERFNPSRWEQPTKQMLNSFMPFGIGPRGCVGVHLARMEMRLATALFFRAAPKVRISAKHGMSLKDMEPAISFLLIPRGHRCLVEV